ncbi:hypothetical protein M8O52_00140 [Akkermansia muciniphila]|uniref:hypothetical protein n=1 Tax=Akkermansia muciniphila TaxID=239935 RepID=UPI00201DCEFE|nr:hypothetical protein [Akkermansia muciniphila]MCL6675440.1 hypothetical protein [Akkermansia muciniphila]
MMTDETPSTDPKQQIPDLSGLADFQFGPAWARPGARQERPVSYPERRSGDRQGGDRRPRRDNREGRQPRGERRVDGQSGERRFNREDRTRGSFRNRRDQTPRSAMEEPTEGLRVELRPVDSGLAALHQEVQKHRRTISLLDLAKVVMGSYDRYDLVFMKQENGPDLYHCKHGDGACFISRQEAVKHLWQSTWMPKYYESVEQEVEAPKGDFKAIAKCSLNNELIGPVNWHGYQSALMNLHRTKFANMTFEAFRSKIVTDKSEEAVQAWQEAVSKRTAWKPVREGASEVLLESPAAVEQDFESNHFDECYDVTDKVFVNGAVKKNHLSPGLWAHLIQLSGTTRRHPSMLIPNLCHGLARHHMPIFKWKGNHYTGPARPKAMEEGTVLSDSLMSIATWAANNPGKGVDAMLKELVPVPEQEKATEEEVAQAMEKQQNLVRDLLWLSEQGYILVFSNNTVSRPRTVSAQAPSSKKAPKEKRKPEEKGQDAPTTDSAAPEKQKAASSSEAAPAREEASEENSVVTETEESPSVPAEELPGDNIPEEVSAKA